MSGNRRDETKLDRVSCTCLCRAIYSRYPTNERQEKRIQRRLILPLLLPNTSPLLPLLPTLTRPLQPLPLHIQENAPHRTQHRHIPHQKHHRPPLQPTLTLPLDPLRPQNPQEKHLPSSQSNIRRASKAHLLVIGTLWIWPGQHEGDCA